MLHRAHVRGVPGGRAARSLSESFAKRAEQRAGLASESGGSVKRAQLTSQQTGDRTQEEFIKLIRKPVSLFEELTKGVRSDLKALASVQGDPALQAVLSKQERADYMTTIMTNMGFAYPVAKHFDKSAFGLPLMGASIYSHMFAGLGNYIAQKTGKSAEDMLRVSTYYRTPILVEEMKRLGYSEEQVMESVAKNFYMQYWSGQKTPDPLIWNPMVRAFYPTWSHIGSGGVDLGRDVEVQAAKLYCMGAEGMQAPVTVINTGDTGVFTDGFMHLVQHVIEAQEKGFAMPIIFLLNCNNSAISARIDYGDHWGDEGQFGIDRIEKRMGMFGDLFNKGIVTQAENPASGVQGMRDAVDLVLSTGKPTYCISNFPFRPGGHASDSNPAPDQMVMDQFVRFKACLVSQICAAAEPGTSGAALAERLDAVRLNIEGNVTHALTGNNVLTREEIKELSIPGHTELIKNPGRMVEIPANYLLGKGQKSFAGMGADIYGKALNRTFDELDAAGRTARYVHQENHHKSQHDTRGGVYGELNLIEEKHLDKFHGFFPQESQVCQVGMGFRSILPKGNVVFVKGPHTPFNQHAADHMRYAAYRYADAGQYANHIYIFDGGSLATNEKGKVKGPDGVEFQRDQWLARVGEHHNSPSYESYNFTNCTMAVPLDMNVFNAQLSEIVRLHDLGRQCIGVVPTASFGLLHPTLDLPMDLNQNDTLKVAIPGKQESLNGRKLVVVGWGPDCKWIAKTLVEHNLKATLMILNFMEAPNSLLRYLDDIAHKGIPTDVICVDPNARNGFLGPVITTIKRDLAFPQDLHFSECTIPDAWVPYGNGDGLLNSHDLVRVLKDRGVLETSTSAAKRTFDDVPVDKAPEAPKAAKPSGPKVASGHKEVVKAPIEGEAQVMKVTKKVGDAVGVDELIAELETDKATVEVTSPIDGVLEELHLTEGATMELTDETVLCTVVAGDSAAIVGSVPHEASDGKVVGSPIHGQATLTWHKTVGDKVNASEVILTVESPALKSEDNISDGKVEITAPNTGTLVEIFQEGSLNLDIDTKLFTVLPADAGKKMMDLDMDDDEGNVVGSSMWLPENMEELGALPPKMQERALEAMGKGKKVSVAVEEKKAEELVPLSRHHLAMVTNMTVQPGDTMPFIVTERVNFKNVVAKSKGVGVTPVVTLIKDLADVLAETKTNFKLSGDRKAKRIIKQVDIGVAVEVEGQLRVAVCRDVANKTAQEVRDDVMNFAAKGPKLSLADQNLENVCWVISSMGKDAAEMVTAVLPKECAGIVAVGRMDKETGSSALSATICHATYSGIEGANVLRQMATKVQGQ